MDGKFCHIEHNSQDPEKAKTFYKELFGWEMTDHDMGGSVYTLFTTGGEVGGGIMKAPVENAPPAWYTYVQVDEMGAALGKVEEAGGEVVVPTTEIPNTGKFAFIKDPTGALIGLWEQDPQGH